MVFGPFEDTKVFNIEKSKMFNRCNNIKPVEFIYLKKRYMLIFVEAKSSSPINREGNEVKYEEFIQEILQKFLFNAYLLPLFMPNVGQKRQFSAREIHFIKPLKRRVFSQFQNCVCFRNLLAIHTHTQSATDTRFPRRLYRRYLHAVFLQSFRVIQTLRARTKNC